MSLLDQRFSSGDAVTKGAIAGRHFIPEGLMFAQQVKSRSEVTAAVSTGQDLLLLSDPGCLLSNIPQELPQAA